MARERADRTPKPGSRGSGRERTFGRADASEDVSRARDVRHSSDPKSPEALADWVERFSEERSASRDDRDHFAAIAEHLRKRGEWLTKSRENQRAYRERRKR